MSENQRDWDDHLVYVLSAYRALVHCTTNFTQYYVLFGRENRAPMDLVFGSPVDEFVSRFQKKMAA